MTTRSGPFAPGTPCWNDVSAADLDASVAFYGDLFGWDVERGPEEFGGYSNASVRGSLVAGIAPKMDPGQPSAWTTYLSVADAAATCAAVTANGGTVFFGPEDVAGLGSLAVVADPGGAVFGLWQAGVHTGFQRYNEPGSVTWNEVFVRDLDAAKAFYTAVFGVSVSDVDAPMAYAMMQVDGASVAGIGDLSDTSAPAEAQPFWNTYFSVDSVDDSTAKVLQLGGSVVRAPADVPFGRVSLVTDPAGAAFSLHQALGAS